MEEHRKDSYTSQSKIDKSLVKIEKFKAELQAIKDEF